MLAHGEGVILPATLLALVLYPMSIWTVTASLKGLRSAFVLLCGSTITVVGVIGCAAVLKDFEWPPDQGLYISFFFWAIPLLCGIAALIKIKRPKREKSSSPPATRQKL